MVIDKEFLKFEKGLFRSYFEKYIEFKRGKGEKVARSTIIRLRMLNHDLNNYGVLKISEEMIEDLLSTEKNVSETTRQCRISDLRQFSEFLNIQGIESVSVDPKYSKRVQVKFRPYIFTEDELNRMVYCADHLPSGRRSNEHVKVYPVIIRILIGTGMRIGEVIALRISDIDTDNNVIKAVNCKNNVSRYIPMSDSLGEVLLTYINHHFFESIDSPLFISPYTQQAYSYDAMKYMFKQICINAGIYLSDGKTPNIHSVRHTFCTRSLSKMLSSGLILI